MSPPPPGLNRGRDAGLEVVGVDGLDRDLDLHLLGILGRLTSQLHVALGDEVHPLEQMDLRRLRERGGPAGGQDPFDPAAAPSPAAPAVLRNVRRCISATGRERSGASMGFLLAYAALGGAEGMISDLRTGSRSSRLSTSSEDGSSGAILGRERCLVKTRPWTKVH